MPKDGRPDSLSLLLPWRYASSSGSVASNSSPASSESQTNYSVDDEHLAAELIRISRSFEDAMRNGPPEFVATLTERYISPDFTAQLDTNFIPSWTVYCAIMERWIATNPGYEKTITADAADVSDDGKSATVYFLMEVVGWPVELKRMIVSVLKWKKRNRRWLCYENITMRGCDTFDIAGG